MPPFRYLGNIRGCAGVRFGLGSGAGRRGLRSRARVDEGGIGFRRWKMPVLEAARLRASTSIDSRRSGPMRLPARVLASEMFVWHAART